MGGYWLWFIEYAVIVFSALGIYKTSRLLTDRKYSIAVTVIVLSLVAICYGGGNGAEEYALPLQIASFYIYLDYLINDNISRIRVFFCGLFMGGVTLLKANLITVWVVYSIYIGVPLLRRKDYARILLFFRWFILGFAVPWAPLVYYLSVNRIWSSFINDYFLFNMKYSSASFKDRIDACITFLSEPLLNISIMAMAVKILFSNKDERKEGTLFMLDVVSVAFSLFTVLIISLSGHRFVHYQLSLVPAVIYNYSRILTLKREKISRVIFPVAITAVVPFVVIPRWYETICFVVPFAQNKITYELQSDPEIITYIKDHTGESDLITVYGNECSIYYLSGRQSASVYAYQYPIAEVDDEIYDAYFQDLEKNDVKMIIIADDNLDIDRMLDFAEQQNMGITQIMGRYTVIEKMQTGN